MRSLLVALLHGGAPVPRRHRRERRGPEARSNASGRGRYRGGRGPAGRDRVAHAVRAGSDRAAARAADRSADARHVVSRQRFAARRHRGRQGDEPHDPRAAAARGRRQCGAPHRGNGRERFLRGCRTRRAPARHPDRDHAPRGLRARRVPAQGAVRAWSGGRARRTDRGSHDRRR